MLILERLASAIQQSLSVTDKYGPLLCQAVRIKCFGQEPLPGEEIDGGHGGSAAKTTGQKAAYQSWGLRRSDGIR